jgi:hypothetical protein
MNPRQPWVSNGHAVVDHISSTWELPVDEWNLWGRRVNRDLAGDLSHPTPTLSVRLRCLQPDQNVELSVVRMQRCRLLA